jgi:uncharacterized damage-inducible protein DinB
VPGKRDPPMDPVIKPWLELWDYLDGNFWRMVDVADQLTPKQVAWQPIPQVASMGWNLQHLAEMLDHYLTHVFGQEGPRQSGPLKTMRPGSLDDGSCRDLQAIAAYHRQVRPAYRQFLATLTGQDLERPLDPKGRRTLAWAVGHIAEHESYHLGKCTLLYTLLARRQE